jgi:5-methylcytosine-specific restriction endonuclease McrA
MIEQAYELAKLRTEMFGFQWHVDHIIPLKGKKVSGLHVPTNLQVIPWQENLRKGSRLLHG